MGGSGGGRILLGGRSWTKRETFDPALTRASKPPLEDIQEMSSQKLQEVGVASRLHIAEIPHHDSNSALFRG